MRVPQAYRPPSGQAVGSGVRTRGSSVPADIRAEQSDLRLYCSPSGQDTLSGARDHDKRIPADPRADSLSSTRLSSPKSSP
ncbi:hypothetical protein PoB_002867700 [Plakobranchus ocellatus]|uniref:Uncharacterized protein n=1 Tax=Plakobranchus ocellatus TaxID=259542 RepID=A0AAV4A5M9_9GAST|nr:hypothetical protein PoB_002867700 [Plakobranchus ocellatus]